MGDCVKFYPVDNGDTIIIKVDDKQILNDCKYRNDNESYDISSEISKDCPNGRLSLFILTHPHDDHTLGFCDLFHCGTPSNWSKGSSKILVEEIICSEFTANYFKASDKSRPLLNEIKRRLNILGDDKNKDGNRIRIVSEGDEILVTSKLKGLVMSPSRSEIELAKNNSESGAAINNTSIIIQWIYSNDTKFLLGGDAEYEVWQRLGREYEDEHLEWQMCQAFHHCSRTPFAFKDENGKYQYQQDAIDALSHVDGDGFVVASCKEIIRNDDNPPSYEAKQKWLSILKKQSPNEEKRFFCPATHAKDNAPEPVLFELSGKGIKILNPVMTSSSAHSSFNKPTIYGAK